MEGLNMLHISKSKKDAFEKRARGCFAKLFPILTVILVFLMIDAFTPKDKYPSWKDTHERYCYARYQIIGGKDTYSLHDEKYNVCLVPRVIDYKETDEKVYIYGQDPLSEDSAIEHFDIYLVIDKEKEQSTVWLYTKRQAELRIKKGKKMRADGDLIILEAYEDFSKEDRAEFETLSKTQEE